MAEKATAQPKIWRKTHEAMLRVKKQTGITVPALYEAAIGFWIANRSKNFASELARAASEQGQ